MSAELREARAVAAGAYRPDPVEILLVAQAPPAAADRYFYFEDVPEQDALFRYVAEGILGEEPSRFEKPRQLAALRNRGVFLIDLSLDPVDGVDLGRCVPDLVRRVEELEPGRVILIKSDVYDHA